VAALVHIRWRQKSSCPNVKTSGSNQIRRNNSGCSGARRAWALRRAARRPILEKKQMLEEDLRRVEKQIYDLEGEYLQV
jgi:hypothetical protein